MKTNLGEGICRACANQSLEFVHEFGELPIADKLMKTSKDLIPSFPLSISICTNCYLLQINEDVEPEILFRDDYPYFSSQIPEVKGHFKSFYEEISSRFEIDSEDTIVEIAGNDGVLLDFFRQDSQFLVNVEPSKGPALISETMGFKTIKSFFNFDLAQTLKQELNAIPRFIFAANVLAHVPNPMDFVKGLSHLADDNTTIVVEVPHVMPMLEKTLFDVIFHQHFSYFSLWALKKMFEENGLYINDVKKVETQGGSLRLYISKNLALTKDSVNILLDEENLKGIQEISSYKDFSNRIISLKKTTLTKLEELKNEGKRIVGYGAPGKAATLLNYYKIDTRQLEYLVDLSPSKQGFIFPFSGLKIYPVEKLIEDKPEVVLILAWNYKKTIIASLQSKLPKETTFISIL